MRISIQGIDMHFEDSGGIAPPLVLLHGFTGAGSDFRHAFDLDELRREFRLIVPDLRGHGRSTNPSGAFSFRQCARDVMALLDQLGVEGFRAVGTSLGAKTMLHVATEQPSRVVAMVIVSPAPYFPEQTRAVMRAAAAAAHSPEEWDEMRARHVQGDRQVRALWQLPARFADDPDDMAFTKDRLATIAAPTLIVYGDRDPLYPVELALEMYRSIRSAALWVLPNGGHGPIYGEARPEFERVALGFLRGPHRDPTQGVLGANPTG